jgi:hypothetical protein
MQGAINVVKPTFLRSSIPSSNIRFLVLAEVGNLDAYLVGCLRLFFTSAAVHSKNGLFLIIVNRFKFRVLSYIIFHNGIVGNLDKD